MTKYKIKQVRMLPQEREIEVEAENWEHACEIGSNALAGDDDGVLQIGDWTADHGLNYSSFRNYHGFDRYEDGCNSNAEDAVVEIKPPRPAKTVVINGEMLTSLKTKVLLTRGFEDKYDDVFNEMQKRRTNRERTVHEGESGTYYVYVLGGWWSITRWNPTKYSNRAWLGRKIEK